MPWLEGDRLNANLPKFLETFLPDIFFFLTNGPVFLSSTRVDSPPRFEY